MTKDDIVSIVPLLPAQQFMLSASLKGKSSEYIQQLLFEVKGVTLAEINHAAEKLFESYECFRAHLLHEGLKQPVWVTFKTLAPKVTHTCCTEEEIGGQRLKIREKGFDLHAEPAVRFDWFETGEKTFLLLTNHHILFDGWGRQQLLNDFIQILQFPEIWLPTRAVKSWYEGWKNLDHLQAKAAYQAYLLEMDTIAQFTSHGDSFAASCTHVNELSLHTIQSFAPSIGLTQAELIQFSWCCFMAVWTSQSNIQMGVVKQNGLMEFVKNGFGLAIQTLPLQFHVRLEASPAELLPDFKYRERSVASFPFVDTTEPQFNGLTYGVLLAYENYPLAANLEAASTEFKLIESHDFSEFPLSIAIVPTSDTLIFHWHFNSAIHSRIQIETIAQGYLHFLQSFSERFTLPLKNKIPFNFPEQIEPNLAAFFVDIEEKLSKEQRLDIYDYLVQAFNYAQLSRIWIYGDKHPSMDLVLLAAWKTGTTVLMVNEKESDQFLVSLFENYAPDAIFTAFPDFRIPDFIPLDDLENCVIPKANSSKTPEIALAICTSGSTGSPKIVQLSLANLVAFFHAWKAKVPWRQEEHFGVIAHPAFDIGVAEIIFPLWQGWKRTFVSKEMLANEENWKDVFNKITAFHMVPTLLHQWIHGMVADDQERIVMTGGDRVPPSLYRQFSDKFPNSKLFQFYGPSECSILASGFENKGEFPPHLLPLGTRFDHAILHVVNEDLIPCAPFQEGEIIVSGHAVGLGYGTENSENFFFIHNTKTYRTGDRGAMDLNGQLYFLGRKDHQIKINGQRIELTRIEQGLIDWSGIPQWYIVYHAALLTAFYVGADNILPELEDLMQYLPAYALPHRFVPLHEFPTNKNGKVDVLALQQHDDALVRESTPSELTEAYQSLFSSVFPERQINAALGWFANGFNSIDAMKLSGKVKKDLNKLLPIPSILTCLNLAQLPSLAKPEVQEKKISILPGVQVHEAAARMFFLSESDAKFSKTYWINCGFVLPLDLEFHDYIAAWFHAQPALNLAITSDKSAYYWAAAPCSISTLQVASEQEFVQQFSDIYKSPFECLMHIGVAHVEQKTLVGLGIHHGLLDGLGTQQLLEIFLKDYSKREVSKVALFAPSYEPMEAKFWKDYLKSVRLHKLPFARKQALPKESKIRIPLRSSEKRYIEAFKKELSCSVFEAGLVGWSKLWHTYFPDATFATGIIASARGSWNDLELVGMSANTLPFVIRSNEPKTILEDWHILQHKIRQHFAAIAQLETQKQTQGTPFFNTSFVFNQWEKHEGYMPLEFIENQPAFDLSLDFIISGEDWFFQWEFDPDLFSKEAIGRFHSHYFNGWSPEPPKVFHEPTPLEKRWEEIIHKYASKTAIITGETSISYEELSRQVHTIRTLNMGRSAGVVPLKLERRPSHIACVVALMLERIPFVPIDDETPEERISHIEDLCGMPVHHADELALLLRENVPNEHQLCYAIATSGTTGKPKLVGVRRFGYEAAVEAWTADYGMAASDRILQAASFSFDVFLGDLGRSIFQGGTLVLLDKFQRKDPEYMLAAIHQHHITVAETTPLIARWWMQQPELNLTTLRLLIVGSDTWKTGEMKQLMDKLPATTKVINSYGLSETTIDNTFFTWREGYHDGEVVPIGDAMRHTHISVCDAQGRALPEGREGLLSIDGPCVGLGYFQDQQWSHCQGPWITADRGVRDEFGQFHFLGRADNQVKIRGQRLELHEIERIFSEAYPKITWVAFAYRNEFSTELGIAYQGSFEEASKKKMIHFLASHFPSYYIPSAWLSVAQFEMNQNGKINRNNLIETAESQEVTIPVTFQTENLFVKIQQVISQLFRIDVQEEDHFFSLGLSSFDAMHFVREWNRVNEKKMKVFQLFSSNNFSELTLAIHHSQEEEVTKFHGASIPANAAQEAIWFEIQNKDSSIYNLPHFINLPEDSETFRTIIAQTLRACSPLFVRFELSETGILQQYPIESSTYTLEVVQMTRKELQTFKLNCYFKSIDVEKGPCFEAKWIYCESESILYFNPHHLVYDGGSDGALADLLQKIKSGMKAEHPLPISPKKRPMVSWESYFSLAPLPGVRFESPSHEVTENIIQELSNQEKVLIEQLQRTWKTSPAVVYTNILGDALKRQGITFPWISMVLDTRDEPAIGMYMRAFPFPLDPECSLEERVAKSHAALEFLYQNKEATVIYPADAAPMHFHQIGLVIQHPIDLFENTPHVDVVATRARLPLSLYIDSLGASVQLRWEYDNGCFDLVQVQALNKAFLAAILELSQQSIERKSWRISSASTVLSPTKNRQEGPLNQIWERYLGTGAGNDFFLSGGTSLKAMLLIKEVEKSLNKTISMGAFFQAPTYETLLDYTRNDALELTWEMQQGEQGLEWYFPPIFGLGFIFNSYPITLGSNALAFNYPRALGLEEGSESIERIAAYLMDNYQRNHTLPLAIDRVIGYSMGGLVAFEVIKLLVKGGVQVKDFIVWDKPAQLRYAPNFAQDLHPSLLEYAQKIGQDETHRQQIIGYLTHHQQLIERYVQSGTIPAHITLYYCQEGFHEQELTDWRKLTQGTCTIIPLPKGISHYDIPMHWKKT